MEEDQNFLKVKIKLLIIILTLLFTSKSYCEKIVLEKLVELDSPWGSSFISNNINPTIIELEINDDPP